MWIFAAFLLYMFFCFCFYCCCFVSLELANCRVHTPNKYGAAYYHKCGVSTSIIRNKEILSLVPPPPSPSPVPQCHSWTGHQAYWDKFQWAATSVFTGPCCALVIHGTHESLLRACLVTGLTGHSQLTSVNHHPNVELTLTCCHTYMDWGHKRAATSIAEIEEWRNVSEKEWLQHRFIAYLQLLLHPLMLNWGLNVTNYCLLRYKVVLR